MGIWTRLKSSWLPQAWRRSEPSWKQEAHVAPCSDTPLSADGKGKTQDLLPPCIVRSHGKTQLQQEGGCIYTKRCASPLLKLIGWNTGQCNSVSKTPILFLRLNSCHRWVKESKLHLRWRLYKDDWEEKTPNKWVRRANRNKYPFMSKIWGNVKAWGNFG